MYQVRLYHDGANIKLMGNAMEAPYAGGKYTPSSGDGEYVTEEFSVILDGSDADITAALGKLGSYLYDAREDWHEVYLTVVPAAVSASEYRSRIIAGWVEYFPQVGGTMRHNRSEKVTIHIVRCDWWEMANEVPLTVSNPRVSPATQVGQVLNHFDTDTGDCNYLMIDTNTIQGDLPGRCRIEIKNKDATRNISSLYVFLNTHGNYNPTLEGEAATSSIGTNTLCKDHCSYGSYKALSWSAAGETVLLSWTLSTALLAGLNGRVVRPMLRLHQAAAHTDLLLKLVVKSGSVVLYSSPYMIFQAGHELQRMPAVKLPPGAMGHTSGYGALTLELVAWQTAATAKALDVDYLQLLPMDAERYLLDAAGHGQNLAVADDGMLGGGLLYVVDGSGNKLGCVFGYGERAMLLPLVPNFLWFLWETSSGVAEIDHSCEVKVWYRARRRVI